MTITIRTTFLTLAAVAAAGAAILVTSATADAASGFHGAHVNRGIAYRPAFQRPAMRPMSYGGGTHKPGWPTGGSKPWPTGGSKPWPTGGSKPWPTGGSKPWPNKGCYGHGCHVHWPRPIYRPVYRPVYVQPTYTAPAYVAAPALPAYTAPAPITTPAANCNCLRKEYTQDNQLVMRDICTNEVLSGQVGAPASQQSSLQLPTDTTQPQPSTDSPPPFTGDAQAQQ
jgi:hypothetical protein